MTKPVLILLHGALGRSTQFLPLKTSLEKNFEVMTFDFTGHGNNDDLVQPLTMELFVLDVIHFININKISKAHFFGYSMGGYVAMLLAIKHPNLVDSIITLATKFDWDEISAAREARRLDPEKMQVKIPEFAEVLRKRFHPSDWKMVVTNTAKLMLGLGSSHLVDEDFGKISCKALFVVGDRDEMVSIESTANVYRRTPMGKFAVLPDTPHPLESIKVERLYDLIYNFIFPVN